jgi:hypothetical protein
MLVLASGLTSAKGTVDTLDHQRQNALVVREEERLDAALILKWRTVLRGIEETPCEECLRVEVELVGTLALPRAETFVMAQNRLTQLEAVSRRPQT